MKKTESYYVNGEARDQEWIIDHRQELEDGLYQDMRDHGCAPVMNIPVGLTWEYNKDKETFKFQMEAKGIWVGKKKALTSLGVVDGVLVSEEDGKLTAALAS